MSLEPRAVSSRHFKVRSGRLDARPIVAPPLRRSLFLASSNKRSHIKNELALTSIIRAALLCLTDVLGPLVHPVPPREP